MTCETGDRAVPIKRKKCSVNEKEIMKETRSIFLYLKCHGKNAPEVMGSFPATFQSKKLSNLAKVKIFISCY